MRDAIAGMAGSVVGAPIFGCSEPSRSRVEAGHEVELTPARPTSSGREILLAYFSRAGENYYYVGRTYLEEGNPHVLAGVVCRLIGCDVHRIQPLDSYSDGYAETVARNVREQAANARPSIANQLASIGQHDFVLLGSPIWNVRAPMIMSTFAESFDFAGKTIFQFTSRGMSGLGTTARDYGALCPGATIGEGLALRGEEVSGAEAVESWLARIGLIGG